MDWCILGLDLTTEPGRKLNSNRIWTQLLDDDTMETKMTEQWKKRPQSSYFIDPASPFFKVRWWKRVGGGIRSGRMKAFVVHWRKRQ